VVVPARKRAVEMKLTAVAARKIGPIAKRIAIGMRERAAMAIFSHRLHVPSALL
jgi:hypothetical protein